MARKIEEVLDPARIAVLRRLETDGAQNLLREVLEVFLCEAPLRLERIRLALTAGDRDLVRREAHLLGGGAANIGALALHVRAGDMEVWAESEAGQDPSQLFLLLDAECRRVCENLAFIPGSQLAARGQD